MTTSGRGETCFVEVIMNPEKYPEGRVAIVVTSYNAIDTIERAVYSAVAQTYPNCELIVVDDCSTDGSWPLLQEMAALNQSIALFQTPSNSGAAFARNFGVAQSNAEYIAFFDDDDESYSTRIEEQLDQLKAYQSLNPGTEGICFCSGVREYSNGYIMPIRAIGSIGVPPAGESVANYLLFNERKNATFFGGGTPSCAMFLKKSTFLSVGGFDQMLRRVEDIDLSIKLALRGVAFVGTKACLYRQFSTQGEDKTALKNYQAEMQLLDKHHSYLESKGRYRYAKNWFKFRYLHFSGQRAKSLKMLIYMWCYHPLWVSGHLLRSAPARLIHERKMKNDRT